jgi:hypothetical protein
MGFVLQLHSVIRWIVLIAGALVVVKALIGWLSKQPWTSLDDRLGLAYTVVMDVQFLLGIIAWLFGPFGLKSLASAMSQPYARFIAMEHGLLILIALALAHIGRTRSKKANKPAARHRIALIFYGISFLLVALVFLMQAMVAS